MRMTTVRRFLPYFWRLIQTFFFRFCSSWRATHKQTASKSFCNFLISHNTKPCEATMLSLTTVNESEANYFVTQKMCSRFRIEFFFSALARLSGLHGVSEAAVDCEKLSPSHTHHHHHHRQHQHRIRIASIDRLERRKIYFDIIICCCNGAASIHECVNIMRRRFLFLLLLLCE